MAAFLDYITAHAWVGYLAFGLLSLVLSKRSQLDGWVESNPRAAGVMKLFRAIGVDPWMIVQGFTLVVKGRLPIKLQAQKLVAEQTAAPPSQEVIDEMVKQSVPPAGERMFPTPLPPPPPSDPNPPKGAA